MALRSATAAAVLLLAACAAVSPVTAEDHYQQAQRWLLAGDRDQASRSLVRALLVDPQHRRAALALAQVNDERGFHALALKQADDILSRDPDDVDMLMVRLKALVHLGRAGEALDVADGVLARQPGHAAAARWRMRLQGPVRYLRGDLAGSLEAFRRQALVELQQGGVSMWIYVLSVQAGVPREQVLAELRRQRALLVADRGWSPAIDVLLAPAPARTADIRVPPAQFCDAIALLQRAGVQGVVTVEKPEDNAMTLSVATADCTAHPLLRQTTP